ncbi:MAG: glycine--tRNA ligase [Candidatus Saccharimonadales bacterium]|jgi:glycyl-tRNA synthetase
MSVGLDDIVSLAKRRGFIYPSSEIYGGLSGVYDYGPLGVMLKHNLENIWWSSFVTGWDDMYPMDAAILMNKKVWEASGHAAGFNDPLVECGNCHSIFRADKIDTKKCPTCGKEGTFGKPLDFNLMFRTQTGPTWGSFEPTEKSHLTGTLTEKGKDGRPLREFTIKELDRNNSVMVYDKQGLTYLRPETAQGMFVNFKNVLDTVQPDLPFGLAQIGKGFRNEISPRDWLFRMREFEMMEIEYFIKPTEWEKYFEQWRAGMMTFFKKVGLSESMVHEKEVPEADRAHYSQRTIDFEFDFPFGKDELAGLAYRGDYDLSNHQKTSGKDLRYRPKNGGEPFLPHVIEPSFGVERLVLALLASAYAEDEQGGEKRTYLKLNASAAPVKVAVFPLLKNKPELAKKAREVYKMLKDELGSVEFDDNGNIGKRYRRQDEIGTPYCITIDFETLDNNTVTLRNRDTTEQQRIKVEGSLQMLKYFKW